MPTQLDTTLSQIVDALIQPGQPFETAPFERDGASMPTFKGTQPSLAHFLEHSCNQHKDLTFLVDGDLRLTFGECWDAANHVAAGLVQQYGVKKGDRIGLAARNSTSWIIAYMGIILSGGCATLLNGFWSGDELAYGIRLAECDVVFADASREKRLEGTDHSAKLVIIDHDCTPAEGLVNCWAEGDTSTAMLDEIGPDDFATILFTSGSTGNSKAAWSDHRGVVQAIMNYALQSAMAKTYMVGKGTDMSAQPCALVTVPLFHVTGEVPLFLQSFAIARKLVIMPKWDAREALRLMEQEKVTYFVGVPLMSYEIATHPERDQFDLTSCKSFAGGGAPRPTEHVTKIKEAFPDGFPLLGYGLTETNGVGCGNFNENYLAKPGSTGTASRPMVALAILDNDGNPRAQGEVGEVCIRSAASFRGYWKNDKATKAAFTKDGYFRTGDLGYLDEDGYLFIVDRKKDIIIRGGENIACTEVEEAIYAHEAIAECTVFGQPDERFGEVPATVYLVQEGQSLTPTELREFLLSKIAPFKVPTEDFILEAKETLPRLGTQKVDKRTVKAAFADMKAKA